MAYPKCKRCRQEIDVILIISGKLSSFVSKYGHRPDAIILSPPAREDFMECLADRLRYEHARAPAQGRNFAFMGMDVLEVKSQDYIIDVVLRGDKSNG